MMRVSLSKITADEKLYAFIGRAVDKGNKDQIKR